MAASVHSASESDDASKHLHRLDEIVVAEGVERGITSPVVAAAAAAAKGTAAAATASSTEAITNLKVPRLLWSYWDDPTRIPKTTRLALASWRKYAPDFQLHFLDNTTWHLYTSTTQSTLAGTKKFTDFLRLNILSLHGGVWMDAGIILTAPLLSLINEDACFSGFTLENNFEPYFIAAVPGCSIIQAWHDEFLQVAEMPEREFELHTRRLRVDGIEPLNGNHYVHCGRSELLKGVIGLLNRIFLSCHAGTPLWYIYECGPDGWWEWYLATLVALNTAIRADGSDIGQRLQQHGGSVKDATQTLALAWYPFRFHYNSSARFMMTSLSADIDMTSMLGIKLRQGERIALERWDACEEGSLICRLQAAIGASEFTPGPASTDLGKSGNEAYRTRLRANLNDECAGDTCNGDAASGVIMCCVQILVALLLFGGGRRAVRTLRHSKWPLRALLRNMLTRKQVLS